MGEVYEVEDLALGGHIALKTVLASLDEHSDATERFKREILIARKITHPNVCRIFDIGFHEEVEQSDGEEFVTELLFLTMELLNGQTLSQRLKSKRMSMTEALPIIEQMAAGLHAAHELGIVHRDFKSSNVMLVPPLVAGRPERAVVTDFGLARAVTATDSLQSLSATGDVLGTPAYMAPEQVLAKPVGPAADIYALGVVMYEMVTGTRPFDGPSPFFIAYRRLSQPPAPPRIHLRELDPVWEEVIMGCLRLEPADRFQGALDVIDALRGRLPVDRWPRPAASPAVLEEQTMTVGSSGAPPAAAFDTVPVLPSREGSSPAASGKLKPETPGTVVAVGTPAAVDQSSPEKERPRPVEPTSPALASKPRWLRLVLIAVGAVAVLGTSYALLRIPRASSPTNSTSKVEATPVPVAVRRSLAILGVKNTSGRRDADWLSTAIAEILGTELETGGEIRLAGAREVADARRDLAVTDPDGVAADTLPKLRAALHADVFLSGSFSVIGEGANRLLRLDVRLLDASTGAVVGTAAATGTEGQLFDLITRAGGTLRQRLGLKDLSPAQSVQVEATLPTNPKAARLYTEGLARLRLLEADGARDLLEQAAAVEPKHPMIRSALASAWSALGYEDRAKEQARQAAALAATLTESERLALEAQSHELAGTWPKAIESYSGLLTAYPDSVDYGVKLAEVQIRGGKSRDALVTLERLRKLPAPLKDDSRIDLAEARSHQELNDFRRQAELASTAAQKARVSGARHILARARLLEATALQALGDPKKAEAATAEARSLYDAVGDKGGAGRALELLSTVVFSEGDMESARRLLEKALALHREVGDKVSTARVLSSIGAVLLAQGKMEEGAKASEESLVTLRATGSTFEVASTLNSLGFQSLKRGDLARSQKYYEEALSLWTGLGEKGYTALLLSNLGELLRFRGDLEGARRMHEEALSTNREIGDKAGHAYDLLQLAEVFTATGDLVVARQKLGEAMKLQADLGDRIGTADSRLLTARILLAEGKPAEAVAAARACEEVFRTEKASDRHALALSVLASSLSRSGDGTQAARYASESQAVARSSSDLRMQVAADTVAASVRAGTSVKDAATARKELEAIAARASRAGFLGLSYEARLEAAAAEIKSGEASSGQTRAAQLSREAAAKGWGLLAREAERLSARTNLQVPAKIP